MQLERWIVLPQVTLGNMFASLVSRKSLQPNIIIPPDYSYNILK